MRSNYIEYVTPQFRILSEKQIEELHLATLELMARTGLAFDSQEALKILGEAGVDISNPDRVKIPPHLVEKALATTPKQITLYDRDGEPAITLNSQGNSHFGVVPDCPEYLDPYTKKRRLCYVDDIADMVRIIDALPNMEFISTSSAHNSLPGALADKVSLLQVIINSTKPVVANINDASSLEQAIDLCSVVRGGRNQLKKKPYLLILTEPVSPLIQGKDAIEKGLLCAENKIPVIIQSMAMAGATAPATFPGCLVIVNAEVLSQLLVLQLKNPGTPVIYGSIPSIMDMKTMVYAFGAPELGLMVAALTELSHYYGLPIYGTGGVTDADTIGVQSVAEATYQLLISSLSGQDLVHDVSEMFCAKMVSPEMTILANDIIDMIRVLMNGIKIDDETLPLELMDRLGPRATYLGESHTLKHFRKYWVPKVFDRSFPKTQKTKRAEELVQNKTVEILNNHKPKPLEKEILNELKKLEKTWFDSAGIKHIYPKRKTMSPSNKKE